MAVGGMFLDTLFGRQPGQYDPTGGRRNQLADQYGSRLSQMDSRPLYETLDPETLHYLENKAEEEVRSAYPNAGRSGWQNDAVRNAKLKVRLALLEPAIKNRSEMRQMQANLVNQPGQHIPGQTGVLTDAMSGVAGKGAQKFSDWLFSTFEGQPQPGRGSTASQGGFSDVLRQGENNDASGWL